MPPPDPSKEEPLMFSNRIVPSLALGGLLAATLLPATSAEARSRPGKDGPEARSSSRTAAPPTTLAPAAPRGNPTAPTTTPCDDYVTGGGWITGTPTTDHANFGISGGYRDGEFWGRLNYMDH